MPEKMPEWKKNWLKAIVELHPFNLTWNKRA
jgi:hypothetical protein